ncbi:MAG: RdgB/HAM1 family non-canonical purine NTP pyrophosphatase [Chitinophagaceae bacterium]|nr:RdgB/HAM1 family non-canonical purine NTP pyrophosphatase [Chitinophagaceae bacterium]MBK8951557.1 RdgB/HAM1 family non-canonical purine NTP pyrophosphatase [Chitinophagaceae bacterium]
MNLIFATNNQHKVEELRPLVDPKYKITTLKEAGIDIDIAEPFDTLEENASAKAGTIYDLTHINCFSEDTGLIVDALNGEPGVKSARYAGEKCSFEDNVEKLLTNLKGKTNRTARFKTVISLVINGEETFFEGTCEGQITESPKGKGGFGYDPVFVPQGSDKTFAEMNREEKAIFSHRSKATGKLVAFLNTL